MQQQDGDGGTDAWLLWDPDLGDPDARTVCDALGSRGTFWHAGLRIGTAGLPAISDYVNPTWMLNRDPTTDREATSWRASLRACLIPAPVVKQVGWIDPDFRTLEGAGLEFGHRALASGAIPRHLPWLVPGGTPMPTWSLPLVDEVRFARLRFSSRWARWALARLVLTGRASMGEALGAWREARGPFRGVAACSSFKPPPGEKTSSTAASTVSVLVPTLDRYEYLRKFLQQLRGQTLPPFEVLLVDQTPPERRDDGILEEFSDLPLRRLVLDQAGQCSARNAGLRCARGEYVLFADDDIEVAPGYVERLVDTLRAHRADGVSGVATERGGGVADEGQAPRVSDVFPAGITLLRRDRLADSGLFDLAYERRGFEDADLGMRLQLAGSLMLLDPQIRVHHHRAPRGGLRTYKVREVTYASSRRHLFHRNLPTAAELYYAYRYFSRRQVRELTTLAVLGTFSLRGKAGRRILKIFVSAFLLPDTLQRLRRRQREARVLLEAFPQIPNYDQELRGAED
jgi:GT2 family glycosyltransferase